MTRNRGDGWRERQRNRERVGETGGQNAGTDK